jgi:hypothetical protein
MINKEYDLDKVCDLLIFGVNGGADTIEDIQRWFEGLAEYHSGQLSQEANHIVDAAINVLNQMIYEKACLVCQYCPSRSLTPTMPIDDSTMRNQIQRHLLSELQRADTENLCRFSVLAM